ncbi:MAG: YceI family protein [Actinomycetota bacterium]
MQRVLTILAIAAGVVLVGIGAWFVFLREDAPEEFELTDADAAADGATADAGAGDGVVDIDGQWTVVQPSEAGYRVVEDLGQVLDFEAVGRTTNVTGTIDIADDQVTAGSFQVDVASITSDDSRRDGQFSGPIMNAAEFPTADLVLTAPITVALEGVSQATATGDLTLRGVTQPVTFPVDAQVISGQIEIVASIDVLFSDYGIDNPSNPLATVRDEGKVEVLLRLDPAS